MRSRGFTIVEAVLVIVVLSIVVGVTMVQVNKRRLAMMREESAANLRTLQMTIVPDPTALKMPPWKWPVLSAIPGQLSPSARDASMKHLQKSSNQTALISPAHPQADRMRRTAQADPASAFTDASYWYLGYVLPCEEAGLAFVEAYRNAISETGKPPTDNIELDKPITVVEIDPPIRFGDGDVVLSSLEPLHGLWGRLHPHMATYVMRNTRYRSASVPLYIERPGLQKGGSNVLWGDGTVEFISYPGPWPMTEKFIKSLESLDELKVKK